ncbi:hypothetical protein OHT52_30895 [Streptomyces sp. NBC_00247]|uniref:beta/gamma crystallin domain-containing protein n=1 Tax=Streptomyces sp. NBC_00247 TaxID=2975689 RepID=UPI002E2AAE48|nr:beta/gamma crystallin domain-containing protein [Streptomyces sp. NBC_00247]
MNQAVKRVLVTAVAAAGFACAIPATSAYATNITYCGDWMLPPQNDLAWVETGDGNRMCFANAGSLNVSFNGVTKLHSGNNTVRFSYYIEENNYYHELTVSSWQEVTIGWGLHAHVYEVLVCGGPTECPVF